MMKHRAVRIIVLIIAVIAAIWGVACVCLYFFEPADPVRFDMADINEACLRVYDGFSDPDLYIYNVKREDIVPADDTGMYIVKNTILFCSSDGAPGIDGFETVGFVAPMNMYQLRSARDMSYSELLSVCESLTSETAEALPDYFEFTPSQSDEVGMLNRDARKTVSSVGLDGFIDSAEPVPVAVLDEFVGENSDYTLMNGCLADADYFSDYGNLHGNMVAGLIGGARTGVYPKSRIYAYCGINTDIAYWMSSVAKAAAVDRARVINICMGYDNYQVAGATAKNENALSFMSDESAFTAACLENLFADKQNDCLIVISAGNGSDKRFYKDSDAYFGVAQKPILEKLDVFGVFTAVDYLDSKYSLFFTNLPESLSDRVLTVGATDSDGKVAAYSNHGADIFACGEKIMSCATEGMYAHTSGTSMAAPQVSGAAALMYGLDPGLTAPEVRAILLETAVDEILNVAAAAERVSQTVGK
ncbi:MAG: S8 family serine peptidase [Clostridia bacterium]|nr:S8 family serine peptidase [Clostridia bacterium]